jgi:predicted SAM-dependent methyltransferase
MSNLRQTIDSVIHVLGKVGRNRKIYAPKDLKDDFVKVNLGSGLRVAKGWLNIDGSLNALFASWPSFFHRVIYNLSGSRKYYSFKQYNDILKNHQFLYHDLSQSLPLHENTVDFIYSSHFLEHLFKNDAANLLLAANKALKPGGIIRISVPDLAYAVSLYKLGKKNEMLEDYFFVSGRDSYLARHKYMYDFDLIKVALEKAGFTKVTRCEYRKGKTPNIKILDLYPRVSLFVEAVKR